MLIKQAVSLREYRNQRDEEEEEEKRRGRRHYSIAHHFLFLFSDIEKQI